MRRGLTRTQTSPMSSERHRAMSGGQTLPELGGISWACAQEGMTPSPTRMEKKKNLKTAFNKGRWGVIQCDGVHTPYRQIKRRAATLHALIVAPPPAIGSIFCGSARIIKQRLARSAAPSEPVGRRPGASHGAYGPSAISLKVGRRTLVAPK